MLRFNFEYFEDKIIFPISKTGELDGYLLKSQVRSEI